MKIFFDTEFTELRQEANLLSIGMIDENGKTFYTEIDNPNMLRLSDWIKENVIANFTKERTFSDYPMLYRQIETFLKQYDTVEMWSDCLAYDWVLLNQLWGGVLGIPKNIYYIPFDICTLMKIKNIDPDVNREIYTGMVGKKHNALHDAVVIKACYEKLINL